ncbi:sensor histidine kinase [Duganella sp. CF517]|uniref:sensor histidine kinase n=1 Tax=Duganella sp. CF517 TaxID=1881038 RepID=UPI000B80034B|nr:ATP-binding protein [Duganella sp. CF517]
MLGVTLECLLLGVLFRICLRNIARRYQARLKQLEQRERVAFDLHDTLLQSMQGVLLRVQSVGQRLPGGSAERDTIDNILDQADEVLADGRHQVLALRTPLVYGDNVSRAFAQVGHSLQDSFKTPFRMIATGPALPLDGDVGDEIFRIGREALFNAFQHAQAGHIELELVYGCEFFSLFVRDDGKGIDAALAPGAGYRGLAGMRERAERMGGGVEVLSLPERGTEVILKVPGKVCYAPQRGRRWRRRLAAWLGRTESRG